jgi:hypothetical protein
MAPLPHRATAADAKRLAEAEHEKVLADRRLTAAHQEAKDLRGQLRRIERTLESVLASDALTAAQRRELLGLLAGTRGGPHSKPSLNPGAEQSLIDHYRRLTTNDKTLVSRLAARFAGRKP